MHYFSLIIIGINCCLLGCFDIATFANESGGYILSLDHAFGSGMYL